MNDIERHERALAKVKDGIRKAVNAGLGDKVTIFEAEEILRDKIRGLENLRRSG